MNNDNKKSTFLFPSQDGNLLTVFLLSTEILKKYGDDVSTSLSRIDTAIFIRYLSLAEQVLSWNFLTGNHILSIFDTCVLLVNTGGFSAKFRVGVCRLYL